MTVYALTRDVVMVDGPDAATYLHSQLSQEVRDLAVGQSRWSLLLQPTGRVDVLARVLRSGEQAFVLDTDAGFGEALVARLLRFKIRVKADVTALDWVCRSALGGDLVPVAGEVPVVSWWGRGTDLLGPAPLGSGTVVDATAVDLARVRAGWPAMGREIVPGETIPGELPVVAVAVSFTKGCYPGQELVERMDSRAATAPRLLRRLVVPYDAGSLEGAVVRLHGADVGIVTSSAGAQALAVLKRAVEAGAAVEVAAPGGDVTAMVEAIAPPS